MKRALFCWEVGEGSGHVVPYLSLIEALRDRGWEVAVAARNTAEVGARVQASGAMLLQAPVCLSIFPEMDASSFNTTELLLQHGYGYEPMLDGQFSAWLSLMRVWKPDLVIGSHAPTAHLASQCLSIPDIAIGSGFNCPISAGPAPLLRQWQPGIEQRIAANEDRVRQIINSVLSWHGFARRQFAMDMYSGVPALLCTLPELDHFGVHRDADALYLGALPSAASVGKDNGPPSNRRAEIFVYLRYSRGIDGLLAALAKRSQSSLVYMPDVTPAQLDTFESKYGAALTFARKAVDIGEVLAHAMLLITNAGHSLTMQSLLAGKPLMLLPIHWEQSVVAELAVKTGAAISVSSSDPHPKFHRRIEELLQDPSYGEAAKEFAKRYQHLSCAVALEKALYSCEQRAEQQFNRTKLTVVG
ncbi:MAG: nucleotide disphospho-sugar-binding domain-containing protein [Betaproteobacteria bacterium]